VDQPDPGAADPLDVQVSVLVNPGRIHIITESDAR
jgi:hypothetical protein